MSLPGGVISEDEELLCSFLLTHGANHARRAKRVALDDVATRTGTMSRDTTVWLVSLDAAVLEAAVVNA